MLGLLVLAGCGDHPSGKDSEPATFGSIGLGPGCFSYPRGISVGADGVVAVVDKSARIQLFDADGQFIRMWSMPESDVGKPVGLYMGSDGKVYVPDTHYHRVIIFDREGHELVRLGKEGNGPGEFQHPTDIVRDAAGNVFVAEYGGNDRISVFSPDLQFQRAICDGEIAGARMSRPAGIDIDAAQTLWVADAVNHRVLHFSLKGELLGSFGSMGRDAGQLRYPYDLVCLPNGQVLVCEFENNRLQWFDAAGKSLRTWGVQGRRPGELWAPWGVARGPDGRIYVVDALNNRVQILRS